MKVWSPKAGATVKFKVENDVNPDINFEVDRLTSTSNQWETLTFDFSPIEKANSYHKVIVFMDFGNMGDGSVYYFDDIILLGETIPFSLPIDFEADNVDYTFNDFGNVTSQRADNPDPSGINTSSKVATQQAWQCRSMGWNLYAIG